MWTPLNLAQNGGSPVLDYKLYWSNSNNNLGYVVLASTTTPAFTYTVSGLVAGT